MNPALVAAFLRQRLSSPIRMVFLAAAFMFPLLFIAAAPGTGLSSLESSLNFALIFGAGMIGQDVSSGVLQLLFARPVSRIEYVVSRWLAASLAAAVLAMAQLAVATLILGARGAPLEASAATIAFANHLTSAFGATAPLLLLSALVPGLGDIGLFVLGYTGSGILLAAGSGIGHAWLSRVGHEVQQFLNPMIDFARVAGPTLSWNEIVVYLSTVTLSLALAIVVLNRKELSYGTT